MGCWPLICNSSCERNRESQSNRPLSPAVVETRTALARSICSVYRWLGPRSPTFSVPVGAIVLCATRTATLPPPACLRTGSTRQRDDYGSYSKPHAELASNDGLIKLLKQYRRLASGEIICPALATRAARVRGVAGMPVALHGRCRSFHPQPILYPYRGGELPSGVRVRGSELSAFPVTCRSGPRSSPGRSQTFGGRARILARATRGFAARHLSLCERSRHLELR
jgi:hypothetical protein